MIAALIAAGLQAAAPAADEDAAALADLVARGERVYIRCMACHALKAGEPHKVGPNLHGFWGEPAASREGFDYSGALEEAGVVWTAETLDPFLEAPNRYVPGTTMAYAGLRREQDRAAVIAFLRAATASDASQ